MLCEHMAADALSRFFSLSTEAEFEAAAAAVPWPQDEDTAAEVSPNQAAPPATDAPEGRDAGGVSELAAATGAMQLSPSGPPGGQARRHGAARPAAHAAPLALAAPPSALRRSPHPRPPHCASNLTPAAHLTPALSACSQPEAPPAEAEPSSEDDLGGDGAGAMLVDEGGVGTNEVGTLKLRVMR